MVINLPGDTFVVGQKWSTGLVHAFMKPAYKFFETMFLRYEHFMRISLWKS